MMDLRNVMSKAGSCISQSLDEGSKSVPNLKSISVSGHLFKTVIDWRHIAPPELPRLND